MQLTRHISLLKKKIFSNLEYCFYYFIYYLIKILPFYTAKFANDIAVVISRNDLAFYITLFCELKCGHFGG